MQVSIVSQEPVLFAESILYNITFGVQDPESVPLAQVPVCMLWPLPSPLSPPCGVAACSVSQATLKL